MNYEQTIDYLFSRLPMFSRIGAAAYKPDLGNTIRLCAHLRNPQQQFRSIHIAGTNGKGSVSHMLAAILQTAGYKTGLYTSPHLQDFRERIKINGVMVPEQFVVDFTREIQPLIDEVDPSFFEITVAMAFDYFAAEQVDVAIIETGLGGRLDSTNIIHPELSIITNIGWDHMNLLGDTLEKIAAEKAGIIKEKTPVVIGEAVPETKNVFTEYATQKQAPITFASQQRRAMDWHWKDHQLIVEVAEEHHTDHKIYHLDLTGIYQVKNLLTVLEACSQLKQLGWPLADAVVQKGLKQAKKITGLHGRWELIHTNPVVMVDVAHNVDGMRQLVQQIELTEHRELHIVLGMVRDKDVTEVLKLLPAHARYYFTRSHIPRALPEQELADKAAAFKLQGKSWPDVNTALKVALGLAHADDLIIICGSVFLAGEIDRSLH